MEIDGQGIRDFGEIRRVQGVANATINRDLAGLRRMLTLARREWPGFNHHPFIQMLPEAEPREGFVEPAEFEAVVEHLPPHLADLARFAYLTAWRKGEVTSLEWRHVDLTARTLTLERRRSKNKRPRLVKIDDGLHTILTRRLTERRLDCPYVFHVNGQRCARFRQTWIAACRAAGFPGLLFHDLRRSGVRNLMRAGVPEVVAMRISGHRTRSVFDRYNMVSEDDWR